MWEALHRHPQVLLMHVSSTWLPGADGPTVSVALMLQSPEGQRYCSVPPVHGPEALRTALHRAALFLEIL